MLFASGAWNKRSILHHKARTSAPSPDGPHDPSALPLHLGPSWSSTAFITHLTLDSTCELSTAHLLQLPSMPTLGLLRIAEPRESLPSRSRVTDRIIRAWAEKPDPFPALRVLQLSCCPEVTPQCLRYLAAFPALVYVSVRGLKDNWDWDVAHDMAPRHGWRIPVLGYDVQALMRRYFGSCLGIRDGLPGQLKLAARLVAEGKPTRLSRLLDDVSTVEAGKRPAVLPWKGGVPLDASAFECTPVSGNAAGMPLGDTVTVYDNPMWWLYAAIGLVILRDGDVGGDSGEVPRLNGWAQPPLPVLSLFMASQQGGELTEGYTLIEKRHMKFVFVRENAFDGVVDRETAWVPGTAPKKAPAGSDARGQGQGGGSGVRARTGEVSLRPRKRRKMGDVLSSMAGG
ncbi:hypothetical protein IMZ48_41395 [Candidatus Bathyarchaeota archaeon]|nr:hypothetical protein [Candidatus Bathyarchaeota archaeon]